METGAAGDHSQVVPLHVEMEPKRKPDNVIILSQYMEVILVLELTRNPRSVVNILALVSTNL